MTSHLNKSTSQPSLANAPSQSPPPNIMYDGNITYKSVDLSSPSSQQRSAATNMSRTARVTNSHDSSVNGCVACIGYNFKFFKFVEQIVWRAPIWHDSCYEFQSQMSLVMTSYHVWLPSYYDDQCSIIQGTSIFKTNTVITENYCKCAACLQQLKSSHRHVECNVRPQILVNYP